MAESTNLNLPSQVTDSQNASTTQDSGAVVPAQRAEKSESFLSKSGMSSVGGVRWFFYRTAAFFRWVLGTVVPLYLIIGTICFIALPKGIFADLFTAPAHIAAGTASADQIVTTSPVKNGPTVSKQALSTPTSNEVKVAEVAKLAIDSTKERVDMMKENYEKLFSLIAALGALLVFFGFKGVESFISAKAKAEETVAKAEEAVARAEDARKTAEESVHKLNEFIKNKYEKDNAAELNVSQGIVLRELAGMFKTVCKKMGAEEADDVDYQQYLSMSLYYTEKVTENGDGLDPEIMARALVLKGNILIRQDDVKNALKAVERAIRFVPDDYSAYYNAACYSCIAAKQYHEKSNFQQASFHENNSIEYLRKAIELRPRYKVDAQTDSDFEHFRSRNYSEFLALTGGNIASALPATEPAA